MQPANPIRPLSSFAIRRQYLRALLICLCGGFLKKDRTFAFQGGTFPYFYHRYNFTWMNERAIEIPLAHHVLEQFSGRQILEVGNVLSHYFNDLQHHVIDKYEKSSTVRIIQADARYFQSKQNYDLIISISTFEHIGWDENPIDLDKVSETIRHLKGMLSPNGVLMFTVPACYHPQLDRDLVEDKMGLSQLLALRRVSRSNNWKESDARSLSDARFGGTYPFANGVLVGIVGDGTKLSWANGSPA